VLSKAPLVFSLAILSGCTATQLRYETLNQAGTVESITEKQIFFNLEQFARNPYALPSQVTVIAGSASTTDSVSPTFMAPLGSTTLFTTQLANMMSSSLSNAVAAPTTSVATAVPSGTSTTTTNGISAGSIGGPVTGATSMVATTANVSTTTTTTNDTSTGPSTTQMSGTNGGTTDSTTSTHSNKSLSLALTDNWMESWTLDPVVNPDVLKRLTALYRYVLGESDLIPETANPDDPIERVPRKLWLAQHRFAIDQQFMCDYPINQASSTASDTPATMTRKVSSKTDSGEPLEITTTGPDSHASGKIMLVLHCRIDSRGTIKVRMIELKPSALSLPDCVVCLDDAAGIAAKEGATVEQFTPSDNDLAKGTLPPLYINPNLSFGFITRSAATGEAKNVRLGHGFYGDIETDPHPHRAFHEFELFIDEATVVGGGGSSGSSGGANQKVLSVPISPNGFLLR
jgi:hypothetical protein